MFRCNCGEKYPDQSSLDKHKTNNNCSSRPFSCELCDERLPSSSEMRTHLIRCGSKTNKCPHCNKYIPRTIFAYHVDHNCVNPNPSDKVKIHL
jgi:hypothetical protein